MTLPYSPSIITYLGNGITTEFPFDFKVWDSSQLRVIVNDLDDNVIEANFSATLNNAGGVVTYLNNNNKPIPSGWKLSIIRNMPFEQLVDLITGTRFDPQVIEVSFDYIYAILQQLDETLGRTLRLNVGTDDDASINYDKIISAVDSSALSAAFAKAWATSAINPDINDAHSKSAKTWANMAHESVHGGIDQAEAWAQSGTNPDIDDAYSKSAKTWANIANETLLGGIAQAEAWATSDIAPDIDNADSKSAKTWANIANETLLDGIAQAEAWAESNTTPDIDDSNSKSAKTWANMAHETLLGGIAQAEAWAQSNITPDINDPDSKSAKTWANMADASVQIGIDQAEAWATSDINPDVDDALSKSSKTWANMADESVQRGIDQAEAWATSDISPDINDADSKSAKSWASEAQAIAHSIVSFPIGYITLMPYRNNDLPSGWYFCNNDRYANTTAQGIALNALSANFKSDWEISSNDISINVPNMFYSDRGYFLRAVNSNSRRLGTAGIEHDAIRNITGVIGGVRSSTVATSGVFELMEITSTMYGNTYMGRFFTGADFDASRVVSTSSENRPLNIGMTPAIFLGV